VCIREVQKSLKDSAKKLIEDKIVDLGVGDQFRVLADDIRTPGGGLIIFQGMVDHTAESIKSLEGFDIAWIEEAQAISARSLKLLRPTIRKDGSEIWASWNPRYKTDPIDIFLRQDAPEDAIVIPVNYTDNPWFPAVLEQERLHDLGGDKEEYANVWLGAYERVGDSQFIPAGMVERAMAFKAEPSRFDEVTMGVDVARFGKDETVISVRRGRDAASEPWIYLRNMDTMQVAARVAAEMDRLGPDAVFVDVGGVGAGVVDRLRMMGRSIFAVDSSNSSDGNASVTAHNKRAEMWQRMKDWLAQGQVSIPKDPKLEAQLTSIEYKYDTNNAIQLERKDDPRRVKLGLPSPDRADALALTFAYPVAKRSEEDWPDEDPMGRSEAAGY
jgi:phage terminase large subunit